MKLTINIMCLATLLTILAILLQPHYEQYKRDKEQEQISTQYRLAEQQCEREGKEWEPEFYPPDEHGTIFTSGHWYCTTQKEWKERYFTSFTKE